MGPLFPSVCVVYVVPLPGTPVPLSRDPGPTSGDPGPTSRDPGPTSGDPWLQNQVFIGLGGPTSRDLVPFSPFFLFSDAVLDRLRDLKNVIPR